MIIKRLINRVQVSSFKYCGTEAYSVAVLLNNDPLLPFACCLLINEITFFLFH